VKFLKKLSDRFAGLVQESHENSFWVTVQCDRCGEVIRTRIDLTNDLSAEYGEGESVATYFCRKVLIGKQSCYRPIEVMLTFDANRKVIERQITGGKFIPE